MNAKCSILSLALLAAWLSAAGTEPTNVVVHWQSTSPSGASRIATAASWLPWRRTLRPMAATSPPPPSAKQTPEISPYAYCAADPVNFIDPTGEDVVVLLEEGFIGHLGMLIQNEKEKWQYYSINGDNVFVSNSSSSQSSFIGGRRYDDIGVGEWDTPQDFLDSSYNTDDDNNDSEKGNDATTNSYEYTVGYQIESSPEQDKAMRNEIKNISKTEEYGLSRNNCASAVIKTLEAAGFEFNESIHSIFADFPDTVFTEIKNKIPNGKTYYKTNKENTSK